MPRTYVKHEPTDVAVKAAELGSGFKAKDIGGYAVVRAALRAKIIAPLKDVERSGSRGRPAIRYKLTIKGHNLAMRSLA
jgi:hypothetical protein